MTFRRVFAFFFVRTNQQAVELTSTLRCRLQTSQRDNRRRRNGLKRRGRDIGAVDNADNCDCQCEAVDKPCRCVCAIKNGGEPFYQRPPQDVIDGWNREKGNFFEKTKRTVQVNLSEDELLEANARDRERRKHGPWPA